MFSGELVRGTQFYGYSEQETVFVRMSVHTTRDMSHVSRDTPHLSSAICIARMM